MLWWIELNKKEKKINALKQNFYDKLKKTTQKLIQIVLYHTQATIVQKENIITCTPILGLISSNQCLQRIPFLSIHWIILYCINRKNKV